MDTLHSRAAREEAAHQTDEEKIEDLHEQIYKLNRIVELQDYDIANLKVQRSILRKALEEIKAVAHCMACSKNAQKALDWKHGDTLR